MFPRNFLVDGEVANLLATSRCNGIWEMTQYNGLLPAPTRYRLVVYVYADLLATQWVSRQLVTELCGETGIIDFGFI